MQAAARIAEQHVVMVNSAVRFALLTMTPLGLPVEPLQHRMHEQKQGEEISCARQC